MANLRVTITCPACGGIAMEMMPTDRCVFFWQCHGCQSVVRPKAGDCCVYCSYGDRRCPSSRTRRPARRHTNLEVKRFNPTENRPCIGPCRDSQDRFGSLTPRSTTNSDKSFRNSLEFKSRPLLSSPKRRPARVPRSGAVSATTAHHCHTSKYGVFTIPNWPDAFHTAGDDAVRPLVG